MDNNTKNDLMQEKIRKNISTQVLTVLKNMLY